jgi:hypothetical protein
MITGKPQWAGYTATLGRKVKNTEYLLVTVLGKGTCRIEMQMKVLVIFEWEKLLGWNMD